MHLVVIGMGRIAPEEPPVRGDGMGWTGPGFRPVQTQTRMPASQLAPQLVRVDENRNVWK